MGELMDMNARERKIDVDVDLGKDWKMESFTLYGSGRIVLVVLSNRQRAQQTLNSRFDIDKHIFIDEPFGELTGEQCRKVADTIAEKKAGPLSACLSANVHFTGSAHFLPDVPRDDASSDS